MNRKPLYIISLISLAVFILALALVLSGNASLIDDPIRRWFYSLRTDGLNAFVSLFTLMGNWQVIVAICLALLIIPKTRKTIGVPVAAGSLAVLIANKIIKHIVQRHRPDDILFLIDEGGYSFSSGHSISSMFLYGLLLYFVVTLMMNSTPNGETRSLQQNAAPYPKTVTIPLVIILVILTFGIGISRIYLGVHYPTDVLGGWSLGIIAICITVLILHKNNR